MNRFFRICFNFELEFKKLGKTKNNTANKKIAGII